MNKKADCIIVGAGLAGLSAAYHASKAGASVIMLAAGAGALSIGSGCIDILGYLEGKAVTNNPLNSIPLLPSEHPYCIIGQKSVQESLDSFMALAAEAGWPFTLAEHGNHLMPTIAGTLKPTGACPANAQPEAMLTAKRLCIVGFAGMRDAQPSLITQQLRCYPHLADKEFSECILPSPRPGGKTVNALDIARMLDTDAGIDRLVALLKEPAAKADTLLLPPICGTKPSPDTWRKLSQALGCGIVEMLGLPPAVGGLRLRSLFLHALNKRNVQFIENTTVSGANTCNGYCQSLVTKQGDVYQGRSFILATGGFLGNGLKAYPGRAVDQVLGIPVQAPITTLEWSQPDIFASHAFTRLGLAVNSCLSPINMYGDVLYANVHVAGRSLAGYDFATEKSGNGVALSTGYHAAMQAL